MLNLTDAERALLIKDIEETLAWRIPKQECCINCRPERNLCKSLLIAIQWDVYPDKAEQNSLEMILEDLTDEDYAELYTSEETAMRKAILDKVYRWRGEHYG